MAGTLALAGLWPFSGFFSKDSILAQALAEHNYLLFGIGLFVAVLTTFYMFRLIFVVFFGSAKSESAAHAHESPGVMVWPLRILAVLALAGGVLGIQAILSCNLAGEGGGQAAGLIETAAWSLARSAGRGALRPGRYLSSGSGRRMRFIAGADKDPLPEKLGALSVRDEEPFYFDELYEATVIRRA